MHRLLAMYGTPTDPNHFRSYYESTHVPLASKLPGLKGIRWSFSIQGLMADSPYFCIGELDFESGEALQAALASPVGQATAGDLANYATGGVTIVHYDIPD